MSELIIGLIILLATVILGALGWLIRGVAKLSQELREERAERKEMQKDMDELSEAFRDYLAGKPISPTMQGKLLASQRHNILIKAAQAQNSRLHNIRGFGYHFYQNKAWVSAALAIKEESTPSDPPSDEAQIDNLEKEENN